MFQILAADPTNNFFIELLEKGGLPALTIGVLFTVFFFWMKSQAKNQAQREIAQAQAFATLQEERAVARKAEREQQKELMRAYEGIVQQMIEMSRESTLAITRLSDRVGQCPLRDSSHIELPVNGEE